MRNFSKKSPVWEGGRKWKSHTQRGEGRALFRFEGVAKKCCDSHGAIYAGISGHFFAITIPNEADSPLGEEGDFRFS